MKRQVVHALYLNVVFAVFLLLAVVLLACPTRESKEAGAEATYGAALLRCVDDARTLAESKACRAKVNESWGVKETVTVILLDAGDAE